VRVYGFNGSKNAYRVFVTSGRTATLRETMPAADVAIPDFANGVAGVAEVDLLFDAPDGAIIRNLTIRDLDINHSWLRDLRVVAQWDGEDVAVLWNRDGDINGDDGGLDDDSLPLTGGDINFDMRRYPEFAGRAALGIFTLRVEDNAGRDVGSIADLDVEIEYLVP
jgi:subtilisin-like proprotein convertase family protein